jgi:hypothetical protein
MPHFDHSDSTCRHFLDRFKRNHNSPHERLGGSDGKFEPSRNKAALNVSESWRFRLKGRSGWSADEHCAVSEVFLVRQQQTHTGQISLVENRRVFPLTRFKLPHPAIVVPGDSLPYLN